MLVPRLMSIEDVANYLGKSESLVRILIREKKLPAYRHGIVRGQFVYAKDVKKYLDKLEPYNL